jgi:hypothetical protein
VQAAAKTGLSKVDTQLGVVQKGQKTVMT